MQHPDMDAHEQALQRAAIEAAEKYWHMSSALRVVLMRRQLHPDVHASLCRALSMTDSICDGLTPTAYYRETYAAAVPILALYPELAAVHDFFAAQAGR